LDSSDSLLLENDYFFFPKLEADFKCLRGCNTITTVADVVWQYTTSHSEAFFQRYSAGHVSGMTEAWSIKYYSGRQASKPPVWKAILDSSALTEVIIVDWKCLCAQIRKSLNERPQWALRAVLQPAKMP
jgi:hypothetical protein